MCSLYETIASTNILIPNKSWVNPKEAITSNQSVTDQSV